MNVPDRTYQLVLNLGSGRADTVLMGPIVDDELAGVGMGQPNARRRSRASTELQTLRSKVSLLAMQKDYWWQRYTECVEENRVAQREVADLRRALAEAKGRQSEPGEDRSHRTYVDRRLLS